MATSLTTADFIFKKKYAELTNVAMRRHPVLDRMRKVGNLGGSTFPYAVQYGNGQGAASGTAFSTAQANISAVKGVQFAMDGKNQYQLCQIDGPSLQRSYGSASAFDNLVTAELKGSLEAMMDNLGFQLFRDGTGQRGVRSTAATNVITLTVADDVRNFFVGMTVKAGTSTSSLRSGSTTVTAIDPDAGTITLLSAAGISGFQDGDLLFREGETGNVQAEGIAAIIPLVAPALGVDSFRGVDRGAAPHLLAGSRLDDTSNTIEENATKVATKIFNAGGTADTLVLSPTRALELTGRGASKIVYDGGGKMVYGFTGVVLQSPAGLLEVVADPDCPTNRGRIMKMDTWEINYAGSKLVHSAYEDGRGGFWDTKDASDAIEGRSRTIWNVRCTDPRSNGVFSI